MMYWMERQRPICPPRKVRTGPLPRVPDEAFAGPVTLERRVLPGLLLAAVAGLFVVQIVLHMG